MGSPEMTSSRPTAPLGAQVHRLSIGFKAFVVFAGILFVVVVGSFMWASLTGELPLEGRLFFFAWLAFAVIGGWRWSRRFTYRVVTHEDGTATFHMPFRRVHTSAGEVERVWVDWWDINGFQMNVRFEDTTLSIPSAMGGRFEFLTWLREHNPSVVMERV